MNGTKMQATETTRFNSPKQAADARGRIASLTLTATANGLDIVVNVTEFHAASNRSFQWNYRTEDGELFTLPADLHQSTKNMLIGIGQRLHQLQIHGFEREP